MCRLPPYQLPSVKYTIIDRGPSLVRTLVNTPGLSPHGDLAVWDHPQASLIQGIVFHGKESLPILGEKDFSLVFPADINDSLTVVGQPADPAGPALYPRLSVV